MKRFFSRLVRFFWSWGFLKLVLVVFALIVLLYVEEDWRGARELAATKAKWEARGVSFDYSAYIPPTVPDDENLAVLPIFQMQFDPKDKSSRITLVLNKATGSDLSLPDSQIPRLENQWTNGEGPNFEKLRSEIAARYALIFGKKGAATEPLAQFDAIFPFIGEINAASATRPQFRLAEDYSSQPPYGRVMSLSVAQIKVAKYFAMHAVLALEEKKPDVALADVKTNAKIASGMGHEPILISGLVACGTSSINTSVVYYGLSIHAWNDAQLAEIQSAYTAYDPLSDFKLAMRGECTGFSIPTMEYFKKKRPDIGVFFGMADNPAPIFSTNAVFQLWPGGWLDMNCAAVADSLFGAESFVDTGTRRVFVEKAESAQEEANSLGKTWEGSLPWRVFAAVVSPAVIGSCHQFAHVQTWLDETRIACALERFRIAHGAYPATIDALAPAYIDEMPHDVINGEPYHYRLSADGTFLLYSVGWNQVDDGGKVIYKPENSKAIDYTQGDWVWPMVKK